MFLMLSLVPGPFLRSIPARFCRAFSMSPAKRWAVPRAGARADSHLRVFPAWLRANVPPMANRTINERPLRRGACEAGGGPLHRRFAAVPLPLAGEVLAALQRGACKAGRRPGVRPPYDWVKKRKDSTELPRSRLANRKPAARRRQSAPWSSFARR